MEEDKELAKTCMNSLPDFFFLDDVKQMLTCEPLSEQRKMLNRSDKRRSRANE